MFRSWTAQLLSVWLALSLPSQIVAKSQQGSSVRKPTIQEQVVQLEAGSVVEIRTKSKTKVRGRLGEISQDALEVQTAKGTNIEKVSLRFDEIKSVKQVEKGMSTGAKVGLGMLAGVGVLFLVVWIAVAASGGI